MQGVGVGPRRPDKRVRAGRLADFNPDGRYQATRQMVVFGREVMPGDVLNVPTQKLRQFYINGWIEPATAGVVRGEQGT